MLLGQHRACKRSQSRAQNGHPPKARSPQITQIVPDPTHATHRFLDSAGGLARNDSFFVPPFIQCNRDAPSCHPDRGSKATELWDPFDSAFGLAQAKPGWVASGEALPRAPAQILRCAQDDTLRRRNVTGKKTGLPRLSNCSSLESRFRIPPHRFLHSLATLVRSE